MTSDTAKLTILIIEDSDEDREAWKRFLGQLPDRSAQILEAETLGEGIARFEAARPDCVLLDFNLPDGDGLEFLERVQAMADPEDFAVILMTGQGSEELAMKAMRGGVADYLPKRLASQSALVRTVGHAMDRITLQRRLRAEQRDKDRIIAELQAALEEVRWLSGLLPICTYCKSIRKDDGYWQQVEGYLAEHAGTQFSHGICPDCLVKEYGEETARTILGDLRHR